MGTMRQQIAATDTPNGMQQPPFGAAPAADPHVLAILQRTVELDVIPRLLLAKRDEGAVAVPGPQPVAPAQVAELVALLLARDEPAALAFVSGLQSAGVPVQSVYLDLLAPAARRLGQMWEDDDCDFTDVTVGLFQLQHALRAMGAAFGTDTATGADARRILLVPLPREQHTFGLSMVADFFRRAGWNAWSGALDSDAELAAMVKDAWFDVVGFSLACDEQLEQARRAIHLVRRHSRNPDLVVMVGGPSFIDHPELAGSVGADGTATDGLQAVDQAAVLAAAVADRRQC